MGNKSNIGVYIKTEQSFYLPGDVVQGIQMYILIIKYILTER